MQKRNGTIEFLRFVFCMVILFFHISMDIYGRDWRQISWEGIFRYGALGVEFFLITSGYFMARSVSRLEPKTENLSTDTWTFLQKKLKSILPYHVCFNLFMILVAILKLRTLEEIINRLSCFFFLPTLGFNNHEWMLGVEWYIGYMLFAMLIIYPFLRKYTRITVGYIAPVSAVVLYGYLADHYQTVMGSSRMIEAFAGILLGISVYTVSEKIRGSLDGSNLGKTIISIIEIYPFFVIVGLLLYMNTSISTSIQPFLVMILGSGLAVTFAEKGVVSARGYLNNSFVFWLGKMSLPIYMIQNITRMLVMTLLKQQSGWVLFWGEAALTIIAGIIAYYILEKLRINWGKRN